MSKLDTNDTYLSVSDLKIEMIKFWKEGVRIREIWILADHYFDYY